MNKLLKYLPLVFVIPVILLATYWFSLDPYTGYIADPIQVNLADAQTVNITGDEGYVQLSLLAKYSIEAVVKSKNRQWDYPSQISKYDLALSWGDLNKAEIDEHINYSQSGRFYYYRWSQDTPVTPAYIASHSANVHLIHSNQEVLNELKAIDKNDHVRLEGFLVNVKFTDGSWNTSLTRSDTGNGSCEILYVTDVTSLDNPAAVSHLFSGR